MKKIPMLSKVSLAMLLLISTAAIVADDCRPSICNLFSCGSWSYQIRGGVYPTLWRSRGDVFLNGCDCISNVPTDGTTLGQLPKFNKFFKLPFIVGSQMFYDWNDCFSLYGELNFIQASPKKTAVNTLSAINPALAVRLGHYRAVSGYLGVHYNFMDWCDCARIFVGAKLGAIYHSNIHAHYVTAPVASCACDEPFKRTFFKHKIRISGGVNLGFDYAWCDGWGLVLTGEAVVSGGPRGACVPLTSGEIVSFAGGSTLTIQKIKTEISFPVTLGVRYNF